MAPLAPVEVIERRRRGEPIDADSITAFMRSWLDGVADDAQMAAWCMAAALEPARLEEVDALARALVAVGDRLDLSSFGVTGDLQSTGAVGDTAPLVALPLAAALGVPMGCIGARGVGYAGGLLDKLSSIPGMSTQLALEAFVRQVRDVGCAVVAPGPRLVGAATRFDALRDATATGGGVAPTVATVMARVIAAGAGVVAIPVPAGPGGVVADEDAAREVLDLARMIGEPWGRRVHGTAVPAAAPMGRCVGNALEVREAGEVLNGGGPPDIRAQAVAIAAGLAEAAGVAAAGEGAARAEATLDDGGALAAAERWVGAQGGDPGAWSTPDLLPGAAVLRTVTAPRAGHVTAIDPRPVGEAARWAGAGRLHAAQVLDPAAGVELHVAVGARVEPGEPLLTVHACDAWLAERGMSIAAGAVSITDTAPEADA